MNDAVSLAYRLGATGRIEPLPTGLDCIERGVSRRGAPLWRAALYRDGRWIRCNFVDAMFGGEAPAFTVASAWREAVLAVVPAQTTATRRKSLKTVANRNIASPEDPVMPGVHFVAAQGARAARWYARTVARDGRVERRTFGVARHGDVGARRLAEAERLRMMREIERTPPLGPL